MTLAHMMKGFPMPLLRLGAMFALLLMASTASAVTVS